MPAHVPDGMADGSTNEFPDGQDLRRARKRARWDSAPGEAQPNGASAAPPADVQPPAAPAGAAAGAAAGALERARQLKAPGNLGDIKAKLEALRVSASSQITRPSLMMCSNVVCTCAHMYGATVHDRCRVKPEDLDVMYVILNLAPRFSASGQ